MNFDNTYKSTNGNAIGDFLGTDINYCHIGGTQDALMCSTSIYVHQPTRTYYSS
jgi:hypothetical protein